jgi:hypothetical protein
MTMSPSSSAFLFSFGTFASSTGYPSGRRKSNFSFFGRPSNFLSAGPQFMGVEVRVAKPALCAAEMNRPEKREGLKSNASRLSQNASH